MDSTAEDNVSKSVKACDACHAIKVKCVQDEPSEHASTPCARCKRLDIPCLFTPRVRKKHQRRTDARVAHLEREVESLRLALAAQSRHLASSSSPEGDVDHHSTGAGIGIGVGGAGSVDGGTPAPSSSAAFARSVLLSPADLDSISRGIGSAENVTEQLRIYRAHFCPLHPVVQIEASVDARDLARRRPLLLQAIVGCTAIVTRPGLAAALQSELTKSYVASLISEDPKSLDLVQALLVFVTWYIPPYDFKRKRMFYQLAHLAISTAVELGLEIDEDNERDPEAAVQDEDEEGTLVERARTYLACYMLSQGVSLTMRRPSMLRGSYGVERTVRFLERSPQATKMDQFLVSHTKLLLVSERITTTFLNSRSTAQVDIRDEWIQRKLDDHRKELAKWHEDSGLTSLHGCLAIGYHYLMVYLNEIALYPEHNPRDFEAPFKLEKVGLTITDQSRPVDNTVSKCLVHIVKSAHSLLDVFLGFTIDELRMLPVNHFFRLTYTAYVMTKLVMSPLDPRSSLGKHLDTRLLRSDYYRHATVEKLAAASDGGKYPIPTLFLNLLNNLTRHWTELKRKLLAASNMDSATSSSSGSDGISSEAAAAAAAATIHVPMNNAGKSTISNPFPDLSTSRNFDIFRSDQIYPTYPNQTGFALNGWTTMDGLPMETTDDRIPTPMITDNLSGIDNAGNIVETWTAEDLDNWARMLEAQGEGQIHFGW